jgi:hypothetical protein
MIGNVTPAGGFNLSTAGGASADQIAAFLSAAGGTPVNFAAVTNNKPVQGSAIRNTVLLPAGSSLSFNYALTTLEQAFNDFAFAYISFNTEFLLADVFDTNETGPNGVFTWPFDPLATDEVVTWGFAVLDVVDPDFEGSEEEMGLGNTFFHVPEPATVTLFGLGLLMVGLNRSRLRAVPGLRLRSGNSESGIP